MARGWPRPTASTPSNDGGQESPTPTPRPRITATGTRTARPTPVADQRPLPSPGQRLPLPALGPGTIPARSAVHGADAGGRPVRRTRSLSASVQMANGASRPGPAASFRRSPWRPGPPAAPRAAAPRPAWSCRCRLAFQQRGSAGAFRAACQAVTSWANSSSLPMSLRQLARAPLSHVPGSFDHVLGRRRAAVNVLASVVRPTARR